MSDAIRKNDSTGETFKTFTIDGKEYQPMVPVDDEGNPIGISDNPSKSINVAQLVPEQYDHIALNYTGDNLTSVIYRTGGESGTIVATLTLSYSGSILQSILRT
jgi:hypothetical protein